MWLREYIFNLLIQPVHLLIYAMLLSSAIQLAETNIIYALVAIGFLMEAEAFIKKIFNFKSERGANSGALATGAMFGAMMTNIRNSSSKITNVMQNGIEGSQDNSKVRMQEFARQRDSNAPKDLGAFNKNASGSFGGGLSGRTTPNNGKENYAGIGSYNIPKLSTKQKKKLYRAQKRKAKQARKKLKSYGMPTAYINARNKKQLNALRKQIPKLERTKRAITGIGSGTLNVGRRLINTDTTKKAAILAGRTLAAGTLGMIGIGAGLASDDFSNVFKLAGTGIYTGQALGKEVANQAETAAEKAKNVRDSFQKGLYGENYYDVIANPRSDRQWYNSLQTRELYMRKYGGKWKQKREEALELRKQGITDENTIEKAIKLKDKNKGLTIEQAGNIMNFTDVSRKELLDPESREKVKGEVTRLVGGNSVVASRVMNYLDQRFNLSPANIEYEEKKYERNKEEETQRALEEQEREIQEKQRKLQNENEREEKEIEERIKETQNENEREKRERQEKTRKIKNENERKGKERRTRKHNRNEEKGELRSSAVENYESMLGKEPQTNENKKENVKHPIKQVAGVSQKDKKEKEKEKEQKDNNEQKQKIRFTKNNN